MKISGFFLARPSGSSAALLALLIVAGFLGNYLHLPLFFGADFLFGSIAVMLVLGLYGTPAAVFASALAASYTIVLWNQPYAALTFVVETLAVGLALRGKCKNIAMLDGVFWLLAGIPLAWLLHWGLLHFDAMGALFIALKQAVNGVANALVASLLLQYLPLEKWARPGGTRKEVSARLAVTNLLAAFVIFPAMTLTLLHARDEADRADAQVRRELDGHATDISRQLEVWRDRHAHVLNWLASSDIASPQARRDVELVKNAFPDLNSVHVGDAGGIALASYPYRTVGGKSAERFDFSGRAWFQELKNTRRPVVSDVFVGKIIMAPAVSLSMPAFSGQGEVLRGFVVASIKLDYLAGLLDRHASASGVQATLLDRAGKVIASTLSDARPMQAFDRMHGGTRHALGGGIYQWQPALKEANALRWKSSFYVVERTVSADIPWTLVIQAPVAPYQAALQGESIKLFGIILLLATLAYVLGTAVSRVVAGSLADLAEATANLRFKMLDRRDIALPFSRLSEVNALAGNFRETAAALGHSYEELDSANHTLEQRVESRTRELSDSNWQLEREIAARERYQHMLTEHAAILEETADLLRLKEREQATLLENLPDIVWMRDAGSRYVFVNRAFEQATGTSIAEIRGRTTDLFMAADEAPGCKSDDQVARDTRQTLVKEKTLTLKEGDTRRYLTTRTPLFDDAGGFLGTIGVFHDISARRRTEEALSEQFALYQALLKAQSDVGQGLLILEQGHIVFMNDALCRIFGYSMVEIAALPTFLDLVHPQDRERVKENHRRRLAGEVFEDRYEIGIVTRAGERREAEIAVATLHTAGDLRIVVVVSDITGRKRSEEAVRQGHRLLDAINAALSQYVSDTDPRALFDNLLADFLSFTGSEYGLIGEVLDDREGQPFVRVHALTDISWDETSRAMFEKFRSGGLEFHRRGTLLGEVLLSGQPVIANDAGLDPRSGGLPPGHPAMEAFMGLPLYSGDDFVGMVAVANRPGGYDQALVDYLQPLLRTLARLVEAYRASARRKLDQQALAHTLAELEAQKFALDQHSIVSIADAAGRITYVNDKFTEISQYAREELLGQDHRLLNSGYHSAQFWEEMWTTVCQGRVWAGIIRNRRKDGSFYWVDSTIVPFLDANGVPWQYISIRTDFSARKQDEDALTQLNRVLKTLSACSEALVHITDEGELLNEVCRVIVEVGGYRMAWVGFAENDADKRVRPVAQAGFEDGYLENARVSWGEGERGMGPGGIAIRSGMPCTVQDIANDPMFEPWREEARQRGYSSVIALPLCLDDDAIALLAVFASSAGAFGPDEAQLLTELAGDLEYGIKALRVRAQNAQVVEQLRQSEERLARIFNLSPDPVSIRRLSDGVYLEVNDAFCSGFGRPREEVIGHDALELGIWVDQEEYQTMARGIAAHGGVQGHEIRLRSAAGEIRWAVLSAAALDYEGERCVLAVSHDITERKHMALELLEAKDAAEQASHAKSEFLARMSHELRTPLNAILGFAQLMNTDPEAPLAPRQQEDMQHILKAGWHLLALINDVLDLARIESGRLQISMASIDLGVVVRECSGLISPLAVKRGVRVIDSAGANESHWVEADPMRLKQVLLNLMSNAVKFNSEQGSVTLTYKLGGNGMLRIGVLDTGPGIAPELQSQLFQPFARLDADKKGIDGTGIGLAISKRMVELMGGSIGVESAPGHGSEFWIELPVAQSRPA